MKAKKTIAVWFSCGAASAVAAKKTIEKYSSTHNVIVVNTFILEEDDDNQRFLKDVEKWIGTPIIHAGNKLYPESSIVKVFDKNKFMSSPKGAVCTRLLKKEARYQFELKNQIDFHVFGFTYDEKSRHDRFIKYERDNVISVLIDEKITKDNCFEILISAGLQLPAMYLLGYPNANCPGCVKATSPTYWNHVRKHHPEVFKQRAIQSRTLGVKGYFLTSYPKMLLAGR